MWYSCRHWHNLVIGNITLQLPVNCWQDNSGNMSDYTTQSQTRYTQLVLSHHLQYRPTFQNTAGFCPSGTFGCKIVWCAPDLKESQHSGTTSRRLPSTSSHLLTFRLSVLVYQTATSNLLPLFHTFLFTFFPLRRQQSNSLWTTTVW